MKFIKMTLSVFVLSLVFSFNVIAMPKNLNANEPGMPTPSTETRNSDQTLNYGWVWLNDTLCVQFKMNSYANKERLQRSYELGILNGWFEDGKNKTRDTYTGKWTQAEEGTWSFEFDDHTIPVGVTKIDDVLYAFNTFGELKEGYEYYDGLTTGADGVVSSDDPEFLAWLETQYVPACTSHE